MRKTTCFTLTALAIAAMSLSVSADDITVKAPAGSGEVTFTEGEEVSITSEELASLVKEAIVNLDDISGIVDAKANISVNMGENAVFDINAETISTVEKSGDTSYINAYYSADFMGQEREDHIEMYSWKDGDTTYMARLKEKKDDGSSEWKRSVTLSEAVNFDAVQDFDVESLSSLTPADHLYEADGKQYYAYIAKPDDITETANAVDTTGTYGSIIDSIIGDTDIQVVLLIDAETYLPHVLSVDASNASGSIPGALFGMEDDLGYECEELYASVFVDEITGDIEVPLDVMNAELEDSEYSLSDLFASEDAQ